MMKICEFQASEKVQDKNKKVAPVVFRGYFQKAINIIQICSTLSMLVFQRFTVAITFKVLMTFKAYILVELIQDKILPIFLKDFSVIGS